MIITVRVVYYKSSAYRNSLLPKPKARGSIFNIFNEVYAEYIQHIIICLNVAFKHNKDALKNVDIHDYSSVLETRTIRIESDEFAGLLFSNNVPIS